MGYAFDVVMSYELGGRAASDLREENYLSRFITEILQHRLDHLNGEPLLPTWRKSE